jgi:hypothetical protein
MKQFLKIVWMMIVEEWRVHSRLYAGRSFALFPVTVFLLASLFSYLTLKFSNLGTPVLETGLLVLGALFGLATGAVGFYGRDAFKNNLGRTNYLIHTSKTLPISPKKVAASFLIKDVIYYSFILILPVVAGFSIFNPSIPSKTPHMLALFVIFSSLSLILTSLLRKRIFSPGMNLPLDSLTNKAIVDISRSSGGIWKLIFSLGLLTFFYWYFVLFFPTANAFLRNPLLSFAVMTGVVNLSVYNWINRFDSLEDYQFLPVKYQELVNSKKKAYLVLTLPLTTILICLAYLFYPGNLGLALLLGYTTSMYSLVVAEKLTKLRPNIRLYHAGIFTKFLLLESLVIVPLIAFSILYEGVWIELAVFSFLVLAGSALIEEHW